MNVPIRSLILIFIPATALALFGVFIQISRYAPTDPAATTSVKAKDSVQLVPIFPDDPIIGQKNAGLTLIAFEDIACASCQEQFRRLKELISAHPNKLKIIWKGLPVARIPQSSERAQAYAYCANREGKFLPFIDAILASTANITSEAALVLAADDADLNKNTLTACLDSGAPGEYQKKIEALAADLGIQAVPALFLNHRQIEPPGTLEAWEELLGL